MFKVYRKRVFSALFPIIMGINCQLPCRFPVSPWTGITPEILDICGIFLELSITAESDVESLEMNVTA